MRLTVVGDYPAANSGSHSQERDICDFVRPCAREYDEQGVPRW